MKQISNMEYKKYQQYQTDKPHSRILTQDCYEFPHRIALAHPLVTVL